MEGNLGGSTGGCVLVRLPPVGFGRYSRCLLPSSLRCISCMLKVACCNDLIETYGKSEIFALDTQRALRDTELTFVGWSRHLLMYSKIPYARAHGSAD